MIKNVKTGVLIGALLLAAVALSVPAFKDASAKDVAVEGASTAKENVASTDDVDVSRVYMQATDENGGTITDDNGTAFAYEYDKSKGTVSASSEKTDDSADTDVKEKTVSFQMLDACPNLHKIDSFAVTVTSDKKDVKPSDYDDPNIRALAEKYVKKGYYLSDCLYDASTFGSGKGPLDYVFYKGFNAVDDTNGNNKFYIMVAKASKVEAEAFIRDLSSRYGYDFKTKTQGDVTTYTYKDSMNRFRISFDKEKEIIEYENEFVGEGIG